ncbi:hypothetical protein MMC25_002478 [Agyrium rufum]|nr:hypothetical protein [Agyrium rufum]
MSEPDLSGIHEFLIGLAQKAGEMILAAHPSTMTTDTKKNSSDLVTQTDQAVETMVSTSLKEKYPSYEFLGEESFHPGLHLSAAPTFVVDPIDGTTNFVHAHPYVSISLGFVYKSKPMVGVVYNPFTGELYHAVHGNGAFRSKLEVGSLTRPQKLPLRNPPDPLKGLNQALVAVEWGNERDGNNWEVKTKTFSNLAGSSAVGGAMVHSLRSLGSAALNLCAVASGTLDAYWEGGCWAWDVAAGIVILREAGGLLVSGNANDWEPKVDGRVYLAVRGDGENGGQRPFVEEFWKCVGGTLKYDV